MLNSLAHDTHRMASLVGAMRWVPREKGFALACYDTTEERTSFPVNDYARQCVYQ